MRALSVLNQTYPHIEYLIIDGGSKDGTIDVIKKYADRISGWVSESDKGVYDGMNKGILRATGDIIYLAFRCFEWVNYTHFLNIEVTCIRFRKVRC